MAEHNRIHPSKIVLVYEDCRGFLHEQSAENLVHQGTLIDPATGDDMPVVWCHVKGAR